MTRRPFALAVLLVTLVPATAPAQELDDARIRTAATRGFAAVQVAQRASKTSQACATTCHLQAYGALAYRSAREHGLTVDEQAVVADLTRAFQPLFADLATVVQGNAGGEVAMNTAFFLVASHAAGLKPSVATAAAARALAMQQTADGDWTSLYTRPPSNASGFTFTALGLRAIQLYGHTSQRPDIDARVARARTWLDSKPTRDTEDRTYQLLGLSWAGAPNARLATLATALVATQRPDGGWTSIEGGDSNAYATAQALVALHDAGSMAVSNRAWQRGLDFLLRTQGADGTWHVRTRLPAWVSPPYFESGYPHGRDQFISTAAANWAVMALARALGAPSPVDRLALAGLTPAAIEPWVETAMFGTTADLTRLLDSGLSPNAVTASGQLSVLMLAAPDVDKMRLLLDRGANVNARSGWKYSALLVAAQYRDASPALRLLLARGADVRTPAGVGTVMANAHPVFFAAHAGNAGILPDLAKAGDGLEAPSILFGTSAYTPLSVAATFGHVDAVRALIDLGVKADAPGPGRSPLMAAIVGNRVDVVKLLLARGADPNRADANGMTPLMYAAAIDFGDATIVGLLRAAGARAQATNKDGETPLAIATKAGNRHLIAGLER